MPNGSIQPADVLQEPACSICSTSRPNTEWGGGSKIESCLQQMQQDERKFNCVQRVVASERFVTVFDVCAYFQLTKVGEHNSEWCGKHAVGYVTIHQVV
jgi:hypothetical protein